MHRGSFSNESARSVLLECATVGKRHKSVDQNWKLDALENFDSEISNDGE